MGQQKRAVRHRRPSQLWRLQFSEVTSANARGDQEDTTVSDDGPRGGPVSGVLQTSCSEQVGKST